MWGLIHYLFAVIAIFATASTSLAERFIAPAPKIIFPKSAVEETSFAPVSSNKVTSPSIDRGIVESAPTGTAREFIAPSPLFEGTPPQGVTQSTPAAQPVVTPSPAAVENTTATQSRVAPAPNLYQSVVREQDDSKVRARAPVTPKPLVSHAAPGDNAWRNTSLRVTNVSDNAPVAGQFTLLSALTEAYLSNPRLIAERQRQKVTDEQVSQALSGFRPTANLSMDIGRQQTSFNGGADITGDADQTNLRIEQPLFRGGGTIAGYQSAKQQVKAGLYTLSAVEQTVLFDTIQAYMDMVQAQSILNIARDNQSVLGEQLKAAQERFDVGEVTRTDVAQSEARLSDASAQVISAEGELISAVAALENFIGKKPGGAVSAPSALPRLPSNLTEALSLAQRQNPQLLRTIHAEKAAKYEVRRNVASILPSVSLVGTISRQEGAGVLGTTEFNQDSLRVNFNIPIYQGGAEYSRVRAAKAQRSQRKFERLNTRFAVDAVVTQAWEDLETSIATIDVRKKQIKAAEAALDGVQQEQLYGSRTVLDVLDAEQELFVAKSNLVRAERDRVVAVFGLLHSMGQLTPQNLSLAVQTYDPNENLDDVKWLPIGF